MGFADDVTLFSQKLMLVVPEKKDTWEGFSRINLCVFIWNKPWTIFSCRIYLSPFVISLTLLQPFRLLSVLFGSINEISSDVFVYRQQIIHFAQRNVYLKLNMYVIVVAFYYLYFAGIKPFKIVINVLEQ